MAIDPRWYNLPILVNEFSRLRRATPLGPSTITPEEMVKERLQTYNFDSVPHPYISRYVGKKECFEDIKAKFPISINYENDKRLENFKLSEEKLRKELEEHERKNKEYELRQKEAEEEKQKEAEEEMRNFQSMFNEAKTSTGYFKPNNNPENEKTNYAPYFDGERVRMNFENSRRFQGKIDLENIF